MIYRPLYALLFLGLMGGGIFGIRPLRALLGNRVTRFLAGISMNYYLIHQVIVVHMKRIHFPPSASETPHMAGEQPWQNQFTLLAFGLSLGAAILITYGIEKPCGRLMDRRRARKQASEAEA
jgi:peptidoglycan/LPS O-acetylase OafA/YrhL